MTIRALVSSLGSAGLSKFGGMPPVKRGHCVFRGSHCHRAPRRLGRAADVRREHDVLQVEETRIELGLVFEYVESCRAYGAVLERIE